MADDHIKVKLPQLPLYSGTVKNEDMVYVWEDATGVLKHATVGQLPFGQGGGGGQPLLGSPFKVRVGDAQVTISGGNTTVSDARLAGKTDYPVSSSQLNNSVFRDTELTYDDVNGTVTILDFELQAGEVLVLYPDGVAGSGGGGGSLQPILDRIAALEAMMAPFTPTGSGENGGRVWWTGSTDDIPVGWIIDEDWEGVVPVALDQNDSDFNTIGKTGGGKSHTMQAQHMPPHSHGLGGNVIRLSGGTTPSGGGDTSRRSLPNGQFDYITQTGSAGGSGGSAQAFSLMNPYRVGCWIKYVGV